MGQLAALGIGQAVKQLAAARPKEAPGKKRESRRGSAADGAWAAVRSPARR